MWDNDIIGSTFCYDGYIYHVPANRYDDFAERFKSGVIGGITGAYLGDVLASAFFDDNETLIDVFTIDTPYAIYMASALAGGIGGFNSRYLDPFANKIVVATLIINFAYFFSLLTDEDVYTLKEMIEGVVIDGPAIIIILLLLSSNSRRIYGFNRLKRKNIISKDAELDTQDYPTEFIAGLVASFYLVFSSFYRNQREERQNASDKNDN